MKKKVCIGCAAILLVLLLVAGGCVFLVFHQVKGETFDSNGVPIHYTIQGKGEPLILIHGVAANADLNWRYPGVIRSLASDFQVIAFDLRGHGLSGQPTDPDQYGIEMIEDVTRLMDHLKIEKAHLAGYSLGGFILLKFLTTHPDRVRSAAICAAGWKDPNDASDIPNPYRPPPDAARIEAQQASVLPLAGAKSIGNRIRNWFGDRLVNKAAIKALKKKYTDFAVPLTALEANTVPAVCFIGTDDGLLPMANDLRRHMANLTFRLLPGANHFTTPFRGDFKRALRAFFVQHRNTPEPKKESARLSQPVPSTCALMGLG